jgi:ribosomal protein L7/L12
MNIKLELISDHELNALRVRVNDEQAKRQRRQTIQAYVPSKNEYLSMLDHNNKIEAIRLLRARTGYDLLTAKNCIEEMYPKIRKANEIGPP